MTTCGPQNAGAPLSLSLCSNAPRASEPTGASWPLSHSSFMLHYIFTEKASQVPQLLSPTLLYVWVPTDAQLILMTDQMKEKDPLCFLICVPVILYLHYSTSFTMVYLVLQSLYKLFPSRVNSLVLGIAITHLSLNHSLGIAKCPMSRRHLYCIWGKETLAHISPVKSHIT